AWRPVLGRVFSGSDKMRQESAKLAGKLGIKEVGPTLLAQVADKKGSSTARLEAFRALAALKDERVDEAMKVALADDDAKLHTEGLRVMARLHPTEIWGPLEKTLETGTIAQKQGALAVLGEMKPV